MIIKEKPWEISAISDAIMKSRDMNMAGSTLFSSHFPCLNDLILTTAVGITEIYFAGDVDCQESADFLNSAPWVKITQLKV